jgi:hypothetical protein
MADPARQLLEDRALRDAARELVQGDIGYIREGLANRGIPARILDRATGSAREISGEAAIAAKENAVTLGTGVAVGALAAMAWVFRSQLSQIACDLMGGAPTGEPEPAPTHDPSEEH